MFRSSIEIFRLFGFPIRLDPTWIFVVALITWTLATGAFPLFSPGLSAGTYWWMGGAGALGLFASVVLHELAHAVTARRYGIPIRGITLFFFGGVAEMQGEPPTARSEFFIAIAGPAASLGIAGAGGVLSVLGGMAGLDDPATFWGPVLGVIGYLALMNAVLAVFNLIPAFPLDGGRILRSFLWGAMGDLRRSTRIASGIGSGFGILLMGLGVMRGVWAGDFLGGIWWCLLGLFVRNAARESWQQLRLRQSLEGQPVCHFMRPDTFALPRTLPVAELVRDHVARHPSGLFPVTDDTGCLLGGVTLREVHELRRDEWDRQTVGAIARRGPELFIAAQADALSAVEQMGRSGLSRLLVVERIEGLEGDRLAGILSLDDLLRFHLRDEGREEERRLSGSGHPAASGAGVALR